MAKKKRGGSPSLYFDMKAQRWRRSDGKFVKTSDVLEYLLTHKTVIVRSKSGRFYRSSKIVRKELADVVKRIMRPRKDLRTDTWAIPVTQYFSFEGYTLTCDNVVGIYNIIKALETAYGKRYNRRRYYLYFEGILYRFMSQIQDVSEGEWVKEGTLKISSKQLREGQETWNWVLVMVSDFEQKTTDEIRRFLKSEVDVEMDHVSLVFKGWNMKEIE